MPRYTFLCESCGEYDAWKSMSSDVANDVCPSCKEATKRVYNGFQVSKMDSNLKNHIEQGMTPKVVTKNNLPPSNMKQQNRNPRPWMM